MRNSRGVQIGDCNSQYNEFQIRVAAVSVWTEQVEITHGRRDAISRLLEDPEDRAAAHQLADDIASAASASLQADLDARLSEEVGDPYIPDLPGELADLTGRQAGERGRARVEVTVEIKKFDTRALAREFSAAARQVSIVEAIPTEPTEPGPASSTQDPSALPPLPPPSAI